MTTPRPRVRKIASDIDSINTSLEGICDNLESITASLVRLTQLAEQVATAITAPVRLINTLTRRPS